MSNALYDWWMTLFDRRELLRGGAMVRRWREEHSSERPPAVDSSFGGQRSGGDRQDARPANRLSAVQLEQVRALYQECDWMWPFLRRMRVPSSDLADAVHDVIVRAMQLIATHDPARGSLRGWLLGIARNVGREYRRHPSSRWSSLDDGETAGALAQAPCSRGSACDKLADADLLDKVLANLKDADVEVLVLHDALDFGIDEISLGLGETQVAIRSRLARARERFEGGVELLRRREAGSRKVMAGVRQRVEATLLALVGVPLSADSLPHPAAPPPSPSVPPAGAGLFPGSVGSWGLVVGLAGLAVAAWLGSTPPAAPTPDDESARVVSSSSTSPTLGRLDSTAELPANVSPKADPSSVKSVVEGACTEGALAWKPPPLGRDRGPATSRRPASSRQSWPPPVAPPAKTTSTLDKENRPIRRAETALQRGNTAVAIRALDEHARRFPDSALAELREALRVHALLGAARPKEARRVLRRFQKRYPGSDHLDLLEAALSRENPPR